MPSGGTAMERLLELVKPFDGTGMKFVLISDGEPYSEEATLAVASELTTPIDTIFIGDDSDFGGADFMRRLAKASGGTSLGRVEVKKLGAAISGLLGDGGTHHV